MKERNSVQCWAIQCICVLLRIALCIIFFWHHKQQYLGRGIPPIQKLNNVQSIQARCIWILNTLLQGNETIEILWYDIFITCKTSAVEDSIIIWRANRNNALTSFALQWQFCATGNVVTLFHPSYCNWRAAMTSFAVSVVFPYNSSSKLANGDNHLNIRSK